MKTLDILIPTYNRSEFLARNLNLLADHIRSLGIQERIRILVNDNASTDPTPHCLAEFAKLAEDIQLLPLRQSKNMGLEQNALDILERSTADYQMYLGDDDYISRDYLKRILAEIDADPDLACILPAFQGIDASGSVLKGVARDIHLPTTRYAQGSLTAALLMDKGHQLSGLVIRRKDTYEPYVHSGRRNIYLFQGFAGLACLCGNALHLTEYPVLVTSIPSEKKDWGYGEDGLLSHRYKNIAMVLKNHPLSRGRAEYISLRHSDWPFWLTPRYSTFKARFNYLIHLVKCPDVSPLGKLLGSIGFPLFLLASRLKALIRKSIRGKT